MGYIRKKCETVGCYRRTKIDEEGQKQIAHYAQETGERVGVVCPECVVNAITEGSDRYSLDFPLGEQLLVVTEPRPRWRLVLVRDPEVNLGSD